MAGPDNQNIDSVASLEACIGKTPGAINMKVIDHLDETARRWLAASSLVFAAFGDADGIGITLGGGTPGFARTDDPRRLTLPLDLIDDPQLAAPGRGFGALFPVPGIGETLRINGRVAAVTDEAVEVSVEECYVHCAKALIRSDFWRATPRDDAPEDVAAFLSQSRFLALATIDTQGRADVSPKGDPQGTLIRLQQGAVWYADRPGNRRADSFRNILAQPRVAAISLVLGATKVAILTGTAGLSADAAVRAEFAVGGKLPLLATRIDAPQISLQESGALARARLWPAAPAPADIDPAAMFTTHVRLNKTKGLQASIARAAVAVPGFMQMGLRHDYKHNLY